MIREQERIEAMIRGRGGAAGPGFFPFHRPGLGLPGPVPAGGPMGLGGPLDLVTTLVTNISTISMPMSMGL